MCLTPSAYPMRYDFQLLLIAYTEPLNVSSATIKELSQAIKDGKPAGKKKNEWKKKNVPVLWRELEETTSFGKDSFAVFLQAQDVGTHATQSLTTLLCSVQGFDPEWKMMEFALHPTILTLLVFFFLTACNVFDSLWDRLTWRKVFRFWRMSFCACPCALRVTRNFMF